MRYKDQYIRVSTLVPGLALGFKSGDGGFEVADAFLEVGEAGKGGGVAEPEFVVHGGGAGADLVGVDVAGEAGLGGDDDVVADGEVAGGGGLASEDAVVADFGGAGETGLAADHVVGAELGGVADEDEIVDLGAAADAGLADGGAVDAGIGLDFDVVFEDGGAGLRHFVPGAVFLFGVAEAVGADDGAVLQDDAIADAAVFADDGVGMGEEIVADFGALVDGDEAVEDGVVADLDVFIDEAVGADVGAFGDAGGAGDDGGFVHAGGVFWGVVEEFDGVGEGEVGVVGAEGGERGEVFSAVGDGSFFVDEDGGGLGGFEERDVAFVGDEGELAGGGVVDAGDGGDFGVGVAFEAAVELCGDIGQLHDARLLIERRESRIAPGKKYSFGQNR